MSQTKDLIGQKFNRLTVLYRNGSSGGKALNGIADVITVMKKILLDNI